MQPRNGRVMVHSYPKTAVADMRDLSACMCLGPYIVGEVAVCSWIPDAPGAWTARR